MRKRLLAVSTAILLSACGSSVKLDETPVADKTGTPVAPAPARQPEPIPVQSAVASVDVSQASKDEAMRAANRIVYFDYDSFAIRPEFQPVIEAHARYLKAEKSKKVVLEGHTDERGGREYNLALGQKRAESVKRALALLGVTEAQLEAVSFGKEKPAVLGSTEAAMEKNRRVEFSYR